MAKRQQPAQEPKMANLTAEQMRRAIPLLQRRLAEVQALDPNAAIDRRDPKFAEVEMKIEDTLTEIFGIGTIEYQRFRVGSLDTAPVYLGYPPDRHEVIQGFKRGQQRAVTNLQTVLSIFSEKLSGGESGANRATRAIGDIDLHPEIRRAADELFQNGHYANAIEDACKALDGLVRFRSSRHDLSGTDLMNTVFSVKNPVLKFNNNESETDRSEQQGMMQLFSGAVLAFRNPRAHQIVNDDAERAVEILSFLSFLAKAVDAAKRV